MTYHRFLSQSALRLAALSLLASLSACSSDGDKPPPGPVGTLEGTFRAELIAAIPSLGSPAFTKFLGVIFDGPSPDNIQLKLDSEQAGCQLLVPKNPFCSPSCGSEGVCTSDNTCTPYPDPQNVGSVHITGLGPSEVVMEPQAPAFAYQPLATLPNPPCAEGAKVTVTADAFSLEGKCIAPFTLLGPEPVPVATGKGVPLTWTPPGQSGFTRVKVKLDIAHHGGKKGEIQCDVPDNGSFEIPEPLVTKLVSLGLAGFPTIVVGRVSSTSAATQSRVNLLVSSSTERAVDTGVKSCTANDECPTGQVCKADLSCGTE